MRSRTERFSEADEKSTATELKSRCPGDCSTLLVPVTGNTRAPTLDSLTDGTFSLLVCAEWTERRPRNNVN